MDSTPDMVRRTIPPHHVMLLDMMDKDLEGEGEGEGEGGGVGREGGECKRLWLFLSLF